MAAVELYSTSLFSDANLVAYYRLEDVNDSKGSYTLINTNSVAFNAAKFNNGADFGNPNTNKDLRYTGGDMGVAYDDSCSIGGWVNCSAAPATDAYFGLFFKTVNGSPGSEMQVIYGAPGGTKGIRFLRYGSATSNKTYNVDLGTGTWHHIVYTYDGSTVKGYLNGVEVTSESNSGGQVIGGTTAYVLGQYALTSGSYFSGLTDDAFVFSRALTATEVSNLYAGTWPSGNPPTLLLMGAG